MILVVDDDKNIRLSLKLILERNEYEVALAEGPKEVMQIVRTLRRWSWCWWIWIIQGLYIAVGTGTWGIAAVIPKYLSLRLPSDEITYTYRITEGVARNQNATYLLKNILKEQEIWNKQDSYK